MNRVDFLHIIHSDYDFGDILVNLFDQYILLYNLLDTVEDISIVARTNNSVSFSLTYQDINSIKTLTTRLYQFATINMYQTNYMVSFVSPNSNSIIITISK